MRHRVAKIEGDDGEGGRRDGVEGLELGFPIRVRAGPEVKEDVPTGEAVEGGLGTPLIRQGECRSFKRIEEPSRNGSGDALIVGKCARVSVGLCRRGEWNDCRGRVGLDDMDSDVAR